METWFDCKPTAPRAQPLSMWHQSPAVRVVVASESELRRREMRAALAQIANVEEARASLEVLCHAGIGPGRRVDAVVLDVTGARWAREELLEAVVEAAGPPVIAVVGDAAARVRCLAAGARGVVDLPLAAGRLRSEVRRLVAPQLRSKE